MYLLTSFVATGRTLEEIDVLFARSQDVRDRLEKGEVERRASHGSASGPMGRRASQVSATGMNKAHSSGIEKM